MSAGFTHVFQERCPHCHREQYYTVVISLAEGKLTPCAWCGVDVQPIPRKAESALQAQKERGNGQK